MVKLLHISDLHFCAPPIAPLITQFQEEVQKRFPIKLDLHAADEHALTALADLVNSLDPDAIVVSGDITTFGDRQSFKTAGEWLKGCVQRTGGRRRPCIVVPGNHDVLAAQLTALRSKLEAQGIALRGSIKFLFRKLLNQVDACISAAQVTGGDPLDNYRRFVDEAELHGGKAYTLPIDQKSDLVIYPFNSVSADPIWMNMGEARTHERQRLYRELQESRSSQGQTGQLRMVILHHNPVSSADVVETNQVYAYNGMPSGTEFLKTLQSLGVDVVLHGHQHERASMLFDFDHGKSGHAYCIGVPSSTSSNGAGCSLISVTDVNHLDIKAYYRHGLGPASFIEDTAKHQFLHLERNSPGDPRTSTARYEVKRFVYRGEQDDAEENALWDEALKPGTELLYISGRHLRAVRENRLTQLRQLLQRPENGIHCRIRILLSDPDLLEPLAKGDEAINKVWGSREGLHDLAEKARVTLKHFTEFVGSLDADAKRRIDIRVSHTVLPFAAIVRDAGQPWGKMVLRLLPIGAVGELRMPVIKLNRRNEQAMYEYYFTHLKYLLMQGRQVAGQWSFGEEDLFIEGITI